MDKVLQVSGEHGTLMAQLEELGWPKEVMARLVSNAELLAKVHTRQEDVISRLDKANGRTGVIENRLAVLETWQAGLSSEHQMLLQSNSSLASKLDTIEKWRASMGGGFNWLLKFVVILNAVGLLIAGIMAAMGAWRTPPHP